MGCISQGALCGAEEGAGGGPGRLQSWQEDPRLLHPLRVCGLPSLRVALPSLLLLVVGNACVL